jgi:dihydroorotate dehydrogenase
MQGAAGVVVNAPTSNLVLRELHRAIDIPVVLTVVNSDGAAERIRNGASIVNVAAGAATPKVVAQLRAQFKDLPIIATGGPSEDSLAETIRAGANAIVWSPPTTGEVFREIMDAYRSGKPHP